MKRYANWISKMSWQEKVGFAFGVLVAVIASIIIFFTLSKSTYCIITVIVSLLLGVCICALGSLILTIVVFVIENLVKLIYHKVKFNNKQ